MHTFQTQCPLQAFCSHSPFPRRVCVKFTLQGVNFVFKNAMQVLNLLHCSVRRRKSLKMRQDFDIKLLGLEIFLDTSDLAKEL